MENVRRDVNHVASRNGLPPLAIDVDHLVALAGNDVEDLFTTRVIVALVSFAGSSSTTPMVKPLVWVTRGSLIHLMVPQSNTIVSTSDGRTRRGPGKSA